MAATGMPLFYTEQQSHNASSFLPPASNFAADSSYTWKMAPHSEQKQNDNEGDFQFIVGGTLGELKSKKNMTAVRKRAMRSYLETNNKDARKPGKPLNGRSRIMSEGSTGSVSSNGSQVAIITKVVEQDMAASNGLDGGSGTPQSSASQPLTSPLAQTQYTLGPEAHRPTVQKIQQGLMETALIEGPRPHEDDGRPLRYVRRPYPLFVSFGEGVDPFKTMFQSSYPRVSVERMKFLCARFFGTKAMGMHWIPTVLSAPHTFLSTLCCAAAHLDAVLERDVESVETSLLRQEVMHLISQSMVHPELQAGDLNVTAVIQLIVSEVIGREKLSLKIHEDGLERMIQVRGGLNKLGMRGYLASTCSWVLLESAILREESPRQIFVEYCTSRSTRRYLPSAMIPESPLYRPRQHFDSLRNSRYYQKQTLDLLSNVHSMIDLFLHPTHSSRRDSRDLSSCYKNITTKYPPISKDRRPSQDDYKYEAIRITAILQAIAIMECIPLSNALPLAANVVLGPTNFFATSLRSVDSPTSPLSPTDLSHDSLTSSVMPSLYAKDLTFQPADSYFDGLRTSISSVTSSHPSTSTSIQHPSFSSITTSHPSISSSTSHPSFSSAATSHSSVSSIPDSYPPVQVSRSRPSLLSTTSSPSDCNHIFADYIAGPEHTASTNLLRHLKTTLDASNLSECWQDMAGVLLWIGLTFGAASHNVGNRVLEKWYSALSVRASTLLSFQHPEPIHSTMLKMSQIVEALREPGSPGRADLTRASVGKRRRTQN